MTYCFGGRLALVLTRTVLSSDLQTLLQSAGSLLDSSDQEVSPDQLFSQDTSFRVTYLLYTSICTNIKHVLT